ncbi:leukocyte immunoglobulin-like receptor subfamily B member 4 [Meriones unguiculatus]|uniref:leukocyte immunoglobulin-like receptor subfamily B member 4 n=1 Tax=Meriones unguiculatus TaxID=10047 RepID=UPI00293E887D|nr:leukocyte immunoglobulin-like receptor subfamily B member 4 [Meriones unguiculatus]
MTLKLSQSCSASVRWLSLGYKKAVLAGTVAVPTICAEPDFVVTWRTTVSIWCQGIFEALEYHLDKEGSPSPLYRQTSPKNKNKVNFTISFLADHHARRYHCYYLSPAGWSKRSDPLELVVTDSHSQDHSVENIIRITLAALVLVILGILLFHAEKDIRA